MLRDNSSMQASFSITNDVAHGLMRITMAGFFEPADIARFVTERDAAFRQLRTRPNEHLSLVDIRAMDIQAAESVMGFQQVLSDPRYRSRRIAFVVGRSLAAMQIRRAAKGRDTQYFDEADEAEAWLLATPPEASLSRRTG
ncbi:hypothetical protein QLH51_16650 [Sphingomonas sp. 2R-10]|uniref:STAS/SEC14 domain-containing protein n=1 Tax=Sphingomonas sp. 2R-10 TaxID=3045148 RepID=UPI000F7A2CEB|nr:STAS/SEC14 domain-containing protein [Sphingomonas sp. 2R-10]MDJ0278429.1 hypothetical protein [Sphingomonas sp. 2R-10]